MTNFSDGFFKKIEKKTNVNKETILGLAKKLQENDLKNENTLREVIQELSQMTGREVSKASEDKIIPTKNQTAFWKIQPNIKSGHAPFNQFKKWSELL